MRSRIGLAIAVALGLLLVCVVAVGGMSAIDAFKDRSAGTSEPRAATAAPRTGNQPAGSSAPGGQGAAVETPPPLTPLTNFATPRARVTAVDRDAACTIKVYVSNTKSDLPEKIRYRLVSAVAGELSTSELSRESVYEVSKCNFDGMVEVSAIGYAAKPSANIKLGTEGIREVTVALEKAPEPTAALTVTPTPTQPAAPTATPTTAPATAPTPTPTSVPATATAQPQAATPTPQPRVVATTAASAPAGGTSCSPNNGQWAVEQFHTTDKMGFLPINALKSGSSTSIAEYNRDYVLSAIAHDPVTAAGYADYFFSSKWSGNGSIDGKDKSVDGIADPDPQCANVRQAWQSRLKAAFSQAEIQMVPFPKGTRFQNLHLMDDGKGGGLVTESAAITLNQDEWVMRITKGGETWDIRIYCGNPPKQGWAKP
jgi:hypothetical protein